MDDESLGSNWNFGAGLRSAPAVASWVDRPRSGAPEGRERTPKKGLALALAEARAEGLDDVGLMHQLRESASLLVIEPTRREAHRMVYQAS